MTEVEPPSALLERAATLIERRAAHFADYQQMLEADPDRVGSPVQWWTYDTVDRMASKVARRWIEMMAPPVAQPLVEWLRDTAESLRAEHEQVMDSSTDYALTFARLVLGEPANTP